MWLVNMFFFLCVGANAEVDYCSMRSIYPVWCLFSPTTMTTTTTAPPYTPPPSPPPPDNGIYKPWPFASSARQSHEEAAALCKWALRVRLQCLGPMHLDTADTLRKLGGLQHQQGLLDDAEGCYV